MPTYPERQEVNELSAVRLVRRFRAATSTADCYLIKAMPLLEDPAGFIFAIGLMIGVATTIGAVFWHRRWLG